MTEFLLTLAARTGDQPALAAATAHASELAERTRQLLPEARSSAAAPLALTWCQGLAGIGQVLLHASLTLGDPDLGSLARQTADTCITQLPRLGRPARCCGAAGIGHFLIDLAVTGHDERYWQAAHDLARHLLLRSAGPPAHPVFTPDTADHTGTTWAFGIAGILPFFRRLAHPAGPDSLPLSFAAPERCGEVQL